MTSQTPRCAITGATGFVGRGLVPYLSAKGLEVRTIARQPDADTLDIDKLARAFEGCDSIVHLLGRAHILGQDGPDALVQFRHVNVEMARAAADAGVKAGARKFVFISSVAVFGRNSAADTLDDNTPTDPKTPYGASKLEAENTLREIAARHALSLAILRPPIVYGPGAPGNFARLTGAIRRGLPLPFGRVTQNRRTYLARENLCSAIEAAIRFTGQMSKAHVIADSASLSTRATIQAIAAGTGRAARLIPVPPSLLHAGLRALGRGAMADQLVGSLQFDSRGFSALTGWTPTLSPQQGLAEMGGAA